MKTLTKPNRVRLTGYTVPYCELLPTVAVGVERIDTCETRHRLGQRWVFQLAVGWGCWSAEIALFL